MMSIPHILVWSAVLTWLMLGVASVIRTRGWSPGGIAVAFGNRESIPPQSALSGRADRAATNMLEALAIFTALAAALYFSGRTSSAAQTGANIFFWTRVAYWPCYLAGIIYLRTAIWFVGMIGLAMMAFAMW